MMELIIVGDNQNRHYLIVVGNEQGCLPLPISFEGDGSVSRNLAEEGGAEDRIADLVSASL